MQELTKEQLQKVIERQFWLEYEILGPELDAELYILWSQGGQEEFYSKWLWEYLNMPEYASHMAENAPETIPIEDLNIKGDEY